MKTPRSRSLLPPAACLLLALIFVSAAPAKGTPAQQTGGEAQMGLDAYASQLDRCSAALAALRRNPAGIPSFRRTLPAEWDVRTGGETFRVPTAWLDAALAQIAAQPAGAAPKWEGIDEQLAFLREQAQALAAPATAPSPAVAGEKLDVIFRQREFRGLAGPGLLERWWGRVVGWIDQAIAWVLARLHLGALSGNAFAYGVIAMALIFLLYWGWSSMAGRRRPWEPAGESGPHAGDGRAWARDAMAAAGGGEFREAIRCAYWAAVARLEEQGAFSADRSRTPRELLRLVAPGAKERGPFRELTHSFELAWYGYRAASPADWENAKMQLERIECRGFSTPQTAGS